MRAFVLALLIATTAFAADDSRSFALTAPDGWIRDDVSGRPQGLPVVFYERGRTWKTAGAVLYANTSPKEEGARTVEELIAYDVAQFRAKSSRLAVTAAPDIATHSGTARVRRFEGDQYGNVEAVAYIDGEHVVVMLVLSARTRESFAAAYPAFEQLVRSYR